MRALSALALFCALGLAACGTGESESNDAAQESQALDCSGDSRSNVGSAEASGWEVCDQIGLPEERFRSDKTLPLWWVRAKNIGDEVHHGDITATLHDLDGQVVASLSCFARDDDTGIEPGEVANFECPPIDDEHGLDGYQWEPPEHDRITLTPPGP